MMMTHALKRFVRENLKQLRFYLSARHHPLFIGFYTYLYRPRKNSLSEFLSAYSRSKPEGLCVVQVGANDGITHDPIHKFIRRDGWQGVLLEPQPYVHAHYLSKIYALDKGIHTVCAALGHENGTRKLYKIGFCDMRWATGLASFQRARLQEAFASGLVERQCRKHGIPIPSEPSRRIVSEQVEVICPRTLIERYGIDELDLLQIDTEGYDYEVIRIFTEREIQPRVMVFEHTHLPQADQRACHRLLAQHDYATATFGANTLAMQRPLGQFEGVFS